MWLPNRRAPTALMGSGRPASPPSLWQNTGFIACCLPSSAFPWLSSGAFTLPFCHSSTSGQWCPASGATWLRSSVSGEFILSASTLSAIHFMRLSAKCSALSEQQYGRKCKWRFKEPKERVFSHASFFIFCVSVSKLPTGIKVTGTQQQELMKQPAKNLLFKFHFLSLLDIYYSLFSGGRSIGSFKATFKLLHSQFYLPVVLLTLR